MTTKTKSKQARADEGDDYARSRCQRAADTIDTLIRENVKFLSTGELTPPSSLYAAVESLIAVCADGPQAMWPRTTWQFLEHVCSIAQIARESAESWQAPGGGWDVRFTRAIQRAAEWIPVLRDPSDPEPKVVDLETREECVAQGLRPGQIAKIFEWTTDSGQPDLGMARRFLAGEIEAPKTKIFPPKIAGPPRQPDLQSLDRALCLFQKIRDAG